MALATLTEKRDSLLQIAVRCKNLARKIDNKIQRQAKTQADVTTEITTMTNELFDEEEKP